MQRDFELIRAVVLELRNKSFLLDDRCRLAVAKRLARRLKPEVWTDHMRLLAESELIGFGPDTSGDDRQQPLAYLTWKGHEFADLAANIEVWARTMTAFSRNNLTPNFALLNLVLETIAKKAIARLEAEAPPVAPSGKQRDASNSEPPFDVFEEVERWAKRGGLCATKEVAEKTGYSQDFIKQLCQTGKLSALKGKMRNSRWRIQRWSVYEFMRKQMVESGR